MKRRRRARLSVYIELLYIVFVGVMKKYCEPLQLPNHVAEPRMLDCNTVCMHVCM